ncbi:CTP synthetase [Tropicimonas sp.]|uniref:CTP synthetase n=1 Tax=Tropicimonas sp. TaxID=2067044 RepID=UPI003A8AFBA3
MLRLASLLFIVLGATLAGILIMGALSIGLDTSKPIIVAAILGFIAAVPLSWAIARQLYTQD